MRTGRQTQENAGAISAGDPEYPFLLSQISDPPAKLYFRGSLVALRAPAVAAVGTRRATSAGKELAREFARALARAGCAIVSGMAFGIDAAAHMGAIEGSGPTIAVLANGLDAIYPASHERLARDIIESGGLLLSEYPPGSPPLQYRFLERNRLISGLSMGVLAVEVPERSGVLATARFALEQNRDLFVVPGPVSHPNYRGSHRLIRQGATLVSSPTELLEDLGFRFEPSASAASAETPEEEKVLRTIVAAGKPLAIDEIIEAATLTSSKTNQALTMLVLKKIIREENGRYSLS